MAPGRSSPLPEQLPQAHALIEKLESDLQQANWKIQQLERKLYGASADRIPEPEAHRQEQRLLSVFPEPAAPPATQDIVLPETKGEATPKRPVRNPQPRVVETITQRLEPEEKVCPHCGKAKCEIGCEKSERFDYIPAKIVRYEIIRPKLACPCGQGTVSIAPAPAAVIEKGLPAPGLLTQVILSKYEDHQPLYRQEQQLQRLGVYFPRQTLSGWVEKGAELLQPVVRLIKEQLLQGDYLQVDETPIKVMDPDVPGRCATGYLWVAGRPGSDVLFEFHPGRGKEFAKQLVDGFKGYLQRDGYGVYASLVQDRPGELIPIGCMAHVRRKFADAYEDRPEEAKWFVDQIRKLYLIEKHAREEGFAVEQRQRLRQELGPPIWTAIKERLDLLRPGLLPQSPLGKAVRYALAEWDALQNHLRDGRLELDNNLTENAIRPSAIGKKNYLFIGHPDAGWRSAVIYTMIASCRRHGVDPWAYMKDVFTRLPGLTTSALPDFLPARWKALQPPASTSV